MTNGQSQSGTAELARRRPVRLGKSLKEPGLLVFRHADAGVLHHEFKLQCVARPLGSPHGQHDVALLGELHGIAQQVIQYLHQAQRIPEQSQRERAVDVRMQFHRFFRDADANEPRTFVITSSGEKGMCSMTSLPASILEKSRISLITPSRDFPRR